jgi:hypothetical protein
VSCGRVSPGGDGRSLNRDRSSIVRDRDVLAVATPRRRVPLVVATSLLLGLAVAPAVRAHEFALAVVSAPSAPEDATGRDVIDGFRLGVEDSPDVSHLPGEEAGDHLGGVDVDVKVIEASGDEVSEVGDAVATGVSVVVVLGVSSETALAVADALAGSGVLVVDAGPEPLTAPPGSSGRLRLHDRGTGAVGHGSAAGAKFVAAFDRRFGRPATEWAARAYDAARLLDVSLLELGADLRDVEALAAAANASGDLVRSTVVAVGPGSQSIAAPIPPPAPTTWFPLGTALALGGTAAGAVVVMVAAHRSRHRSVG